MKRRVGSKQRLRAKGDGRILLERSVDLLDELAGAVPGLSAAADLEALRNEWGR